MLHPTDRKEALAIVLAVAVAHCFSKQTGFASAPIAVFGDINPMKVTTDEIRRSITLLQITDEPFPMVIGPMPIPPTPADPHYDGPKVLFGRNCYGSNLPPVVGDLRWRGRPFPFPPMEGDPRWHLPPRPYVPPTA